jgi:hypothetical protein
VIDRVRPDHHATCGGEVQLEEAEQRPVGHSSHHVAVVFAVDAKFALGNLDVIPMGIDFDAERDHVGKVRP